MVQTYSQTDRTIFKNEIAEDFERTKSVLPMTFNSEGIKSGKTFQWDVAGLSGSAKQRGRDGNLVRGAQVFSKVTADIVEEFSEKLTIDDIDAFTGNPNLRGVLGKKTIAQCVRATDQKCVDILDATSVEYNASGSAITLSSLANCMKIRDALFLNDVPADDGRVTFLITLPAASQLMRIPEFKSRDYIDLMPAQNGLPARRMVRWLDVNWMTFNGLTGKGTANAKCYAYHASAVGHCYDGEPDPYVYWFEPEHRWEHYAVIRNAGVAVLPRGITRFYHDDTAAYA